MTRDEKASAGRLSGGDGLGTEAEERSFEAAEGLERILVHCVEEHGLPYERSDVRRALREAIRTWPGKPGERWRRWLSEAGASLDLRVSVIESPLGDILKWVEEGVEVAAAISRDGRDEWVVLSGAPRRGRYSVFGVAGNEGSVKMSRSRLRRFLGANDEEETIRATVLEPALTCAPAHHERELFGGNHLSPMARLLMIARAEWSDIWVLLVFALISGILALATPMAVQVMVSLVAFGQLLQPVIVLSLMLLGLTAFWAMLRLWETYVAEVLQRRLFARVVHDVGYRLPRVRQDALGGRYGPELANRFFDIVTVQKVTTQFLLDAVDLVMVGVIGMAVLAVYHPFLLGFDLLLLSAIAFVIFVLGRGGTRTSIQESKYKYATAAWLEEIARCPLTFKMDDAAEFAAERAEHVVSRYLEHRRLHFRVLLRQIAFALLLYALAGSVLLGVGGWLVIQGQLTLGQLVAAEMIVAIIVGAFTKIGKHLEAFYDLMAGLDKLGQLFDLPLERQHGLMRLPETEPAELAVRGLTYHLGKRSVLEELDLHVRPGERVAITGPTGCGKSLMADLLYGLREPTRGRIFVDDHDLSEVRPDAWRRHVMLLRPGEIFRGSAMENVHLDDPDIDQRWVRSAFQTLGLLESDGLPDGLDTQLSPTGAPLSGSQQRLLILARALVHQPRLLILDELLDSLSSLALERALDVLLDPDAPWTLLVITSHPGVIARCHRVIDLASQGDWQRPVSLPRDR